MDLSKDHSNDYPHLIGKRIRIIHMEGEVGYDGREGVVEYADSMGQLHGTWGGLAVQPENDEFEIVEESK
jgi:hypothetical protein